MHGSGDRGGASGVGQDCDVGLMMGVNVGFSAGTGTTFYAAAHERRAYGGGEGAFGGDQEANGAGGERGFAGHLHGVQW
jgi:hypothetical protein